MTHYFKNKEGNKMIGVDGDRVTEYDLMFTVGVNETFEEETLIVEPTKTVIFKKNTTKKKVVDMSHLSAEQKKEAQREKHKEYMKEYNKKYKKADKVQVTFEPNQKLIQEFGKSTIDQMIICKRQGMTAEEVDEDKPVHCGHLVFGQIERILDTVKR